MGMLSTLSSPCSSPCSSTTIISLGCWNSTEGTLLRVNRILPLMDIMFVTKIPVDICKACNDVYIKEGKSRKREEKEEGEQRKGVHMRVSVEEIISPPFRLVCWVWDEKENTKLSHMPFTAINRMYTQYNWRFRMRVGYCQEADNTKGTRRGRTKDPIKAKMEPP